jgi:malate dehydrogenase
MNDNSTFPPKKVVVTGAAGRIGSHILFLVAQGLLYGHKQSVRLCLLEKQKNWGRCSSLKMELEDSLFPLLKSIHYSDENDEAFVEADSVFFCGAKICTDPTQKHEIQNENWQALKTQGESINRVCKSNTLFLMVANPCNTNTLVLIESAPKIPSTNFHALVRLDQNRAQQLIAQQIGFLSVQVKDTVVWGNHSQTVVPDLSNAKINNTPIRNLIPMDWCETDYIKSVQKRGALITQTSLGFSSCISAAYAAIESMKALMIPTPKNSFYCTGIYSKGNPFGFDEHLVFSLPCRTLSRGNYEFIKECVPRLPLLPLIKQSELELIEERSQIKI